jgi:integrase
VRQWEKTTKTTSGTRAVELQPESRKAIEAQEAFTKKEHRVFHDPTTDKPWKGDHIIRKRLWIPALNNSGVDYSNPYLTRHSFVSMLLSRGKNSLWVVQQMGHKDWGVIRKVYGRRVE